MDATPSVRLPAHAPASGVPERPPRPLTVRGARFAWGTRTFVMGVVNVTPDSFSGDGVLARAGSGPGATARDSLDPLEAPAWLSPWSRAG